MNDPTLRIDSNQPQMNPAHLSAHPSLPLGPAVRVEVVLGRAIAHASDITVTDILVRVIGSGQGVSNTRTPLNLCLVIDRSGSMDGQPLSCVRDACNYVVRQLGPSDILSIVTFEENVDIVLPAKHVTEPGLISAYIDRITAGNTTNLFDGLYAGGVQVTSVPLSGYASRLILLTDGEPTAGIRDHASILRQVEQLRSQGVAVSAMGFGPDYQEDLMAGIARAGGGSYTYISAAEDIVGAFKKELSSAMAIVATKPRLQFELPDNNRLLTTVELDLPDIEAGTVIDRLISIESGPRGTGTYRIGKVTLDATNPASKQTLRTTADAAVVFADQANASLQPLHPAIATAKGMHTAAVNLERTLSSMRTMSFSARDVTASLERTQQLLVDTGQVDAAAQVADATRAFQAGNQDHLEKTLIGTLYALDLGKHSGGAS